MPAPVAALAAAMTANVALDMVARGNLAVPSAGGLRN